MANKYESAQLLLKLYEIRREETMRRARDWFIGFFPESSQDITTNLTLLLNTILVWGQ